MQGARIIRIHSSPMLKLLIGFAHNIPNNTLPIIWGEGTSAAPWHALFRRYEKR